MHAYYQKNRNRLQKKMRSILSLVGPELESAGGKPYDAAFADIWNLYERDMLEHFPYIGGDGASGTKNLTEAYMLVAMGEYLKAHGKVRRHDEGLQRRYVYRHNQGGKRKHTALSGGKYNIVEIGEEKVENTVDFTILGGEFANITIGGKGKLILDFLAEGKALEDMNTGEIIDGRAGIAGNVKVVAHTHSCVWNTKTHEKLCGCGFVEETDADAPSVDGLTDGKTYCGDFSFTVSDANTFTVTLNGTLLVPDENGR